MKQRDIHVLNWNKIIQNTLENEKMGKDNKIINKGILFEDLIENLLKAMFPKECWRRTIKSHDGKRDFVYPEDETLPDIKWAECKNYNSNVSINVIAPTLIMGAIENIRSIYFFSYSPLNENAIENLLRYSRTSKKMIMVFDGNVLESLICKYHNVNNISSAFPDTDFEKAYEILKTKKICAIRHMSDLNGNRISSAHQFELGETFNIHIILQNLIHEPTTYNLAVNPSNKKILINKPAKNHYPLEFAEIAECSICCQALIAGNVRVDVTIDGINPPINLTQKIKVTDDAYLFWTGTNSLFIRDQCMEYLRNKEEMPLIIAAGLGMGKSTLINIIANESEIIEKYKILNIDLKLTRNYCVRDLFSTILDLHQESPTPDEQIEDDNAIISLLIENYAESAKKIAEIILEFYDPTHPYLIVVDDIHNINRIYTSMLIEIKNKAQEKGKDIYYLFALDDSKISVDELLRSLNFKTDRNSQLDNVVRIPFFEKEDILIFIKHKFGLENIDFYFNEFDQKVSPDKVHKFCFSMKSLRVVAPKSDLSSYQILDPFAFEEGIKNILCNGISLSTICLSLGQNDIPEYVLKYLYVVGEMSSETAQKYQSSINGLVSCDIIKEKNGIFVLCQEEMRKKIKECFRFYEEDYSDIYMDNTIDAASKAICVLNQPNRIRNGLQFLQKFFKSKYEIKKRIHRYEICWLIFQNLDQLVHHNLIKDALNFVQKNYVLLNQENGHSSFYIFLKYIADVSLISNWDTDTSSVENMAFFIKKYFDRSLSTYNYQDCLVYFNKYENIFYQLKNISDSKRFYWLAHYANRVAIALDRASIPLMEEPAEISKLYKKSDFYRQKSISNKELDLQILVDEFNRHYFYRHDLNNDIIHKTFNGLVHIKSQFTKINELLEYHLLLLEYMSIRTDNLKNYHANFDCLISKVKTIHKKCFSAFFKLKLYILEIYILIDLQRFTDADDIIDLASEFCYKRELRSYLYKLTYIKAFLQIFLQENYTSSESYHLILLAYEQLLQVRKNSLNDLKREIYLIVQLVRQINTQKSKDIKVYSKLYGKDIENLIIKITKYIKGEKTDNDILFDMHSYFVFNKISFPNI